MSPFSFRRVTAKDARALVHAPGLGGSEMVQAKMILHAVQTQGEKAVRQYAEKFGDRRNDESLVLGEEEIRAGVKEVSKDTLALLKRVAKRIETFAKAQKKSLKPLTTKIAGGLAGHDLVPLERVGCYAPSGRYPLPSTILMTAITAKVAGVENIILATPRPSAVMLAAAQIAGVSRILAVGGAQAIGALAYGCGEIPRCDMIVGPGNAWVTAAKKLVAGEVAIDMLAGPTELVVLADKTAKAAWIAADLLAQAEHDPAARPILIGLQEDLIAAVEGEINEQLADLPSAPIALQALANGFAVFTEDLSEALSLCDALAPEHLELCVAEAPQLAKKIRHAGAVFIGAHSAEVFGDYGLGPNHVLPTAGGARFTGGLSVLNFLRVRTWMEITNVERARIAVNDAVSLARLENLEAHARAAEKRR